MTDARICIPVEQDDYQAIIEDAAACRTMLDEMIARYPSIFPAEIGQGYKLNLGQYHLPGTTVQEPEKLPEDLLADEKHTRLNGEKAYIATTVGDDCLPGAAIAPDAGEDSLSEACSHFKREAREVRADYQPKTV